MTAASKLRTKRRYAHELYPHAAEGEVRPLEVEVPYLYAWATGLNVQGTSWADGKTPEERERGMDRIALKINARQRALLADALLQGLAGQKAWQWAEERLDEEGAWVWERASHYGVDLARIKPYPCGPEPANHDHMASTGDSLGYGLVTRVQGPESECPTCCEPVEGGDQ